VGYGVCWWVTWSLLLRVLLPALKGGQRSVFITINYSLSLLLCYIISLCTEIVSLPLFYVLMKQNSRPIPFQFLPYPHPKKNKDESPSLYLAKTFTTLSPPALTTHRLSWLYATEHITTHDLIMWTDPRGPGWEVVEEFKLFYPRGSRQLRNPSHTAKLNISRIYAASVVGKRTQSRLLKQMACMRSHHGCQELG
jgi:hypothetical protein